MFLSTGNQKVSKFSASYMVSILVSRSIINQFHACITWSIFKLGQDKTIVCLFGIDSRLIEIHPLIKCISKIKELFFKLRFLIFANFYQLNFKIEKWWWWWRCRLWNMIMHECHYQFIIIKFILFHPPPQLKMMSHHFSG